MAHHNDEEQLPSNNDTETVEEYWKKKVTKLVSTLENAILYQWRENVRSERSDVVVDLSSRFSNVLPRRAAEEPQCTSVNCCCTTVDGPSSSSSSSSFVADDE